MGGLRTFSLLPKLLRQVLRRIPSSARPGSTPPECPFFCGVTPNPLGLSPACLAGFFTFAASFANSFGCRGGRGASTGRPPLSPHTALLRISSLIFPFADLLLLLLLAGVQRRLRYTPLLRTLPPAKSTDSAEALHSAFSGPRLATAVPWLGYHIAWHNFLVEDVPLVRSTFQPICLSQPSSLYLCLPSPFFFLEPCLREFLNP